jgi:hypothetical protein
MDADLDLLLTAVYVTADDLLPEKPKNAKRSVTDAEVVTLCVAQAIMGIPSGQRFLAVASKHLRHLFPRDPRGKPAALSQRNVARALRTAQRAAVDKDGRPMFPALHERDAKGKPAKVPRGREICRQLR